MLKDIDPYHANVMGANYGANYGTNKQTGFSGHGLYEELRDDFNRALQNEGNWASDWESLIDKIQGKIEGISNKEDGKSPEETFNSLKEFKNHLNSNELKLPPCKTTKRSKDLNFQLKRLLGILDSIDTKDAIPKENYEKTFVQGKDGGDPYSLCPLINNYIDYVNGTEENKTEENKTEENKKKEMGRQRFTLHHRTQSNKGETLKKDDNKDDSIDYVNKAKENKTENKDKNGKTKLDYIPDLIELTDSPSEFDDFYKYLLNNNKIPSNLEVQDARLHFNKEIRSQVAKNLFQREVINTIADELKIDPTEVEKCICVIGFNRLFSPGNDMGATTPSDVDCKVYFNYKKYEEIRKTKYPNENIVDQKKFSDILIKTCGKLKETVEGSTNNKFEIEVHKNAINNIEVIKEYIEKNIKTELNFLATIMHGNSYICGSTEIYESFKESITDFFKKQGMFKFCRRIIKQNLTEKSDKGSIGLILEYLLHPDKCKKKFEGHRQYQDADYDKYLSVKYFLCRPYDTLTQLGDENIGCVNKETRANARRLLNIGQAFQTLKTDYFSRNKRELGEEYTNISPREIVEILRKQGRTDEPAIKKLKDGLVDLGIDYKFIENIEDLSDDEACKQAAACLDKLMMTATQFTVDVKDTFGMNASSIEGFSDFIGDIQQLKENEMNPELLGTTTKAIFGNYWETKTITHWAVRLYQYLYYSTDYLKCTPPHTTSLYYRVLDALEEIKERLNEKSPITGKEYSKRDALNILKDPLLSILNAIKEEIDAHDKKIYKLDSNKKDKIHEGWADHYCEYIDKLIDEIEKIFGEKCDEDIMRYKEIIGKYKEKYKEKTSENNVSEGLQS